MVRNVVAVATILAYIIGAWSMLPLMGRLPAAAQGGGLIRVSIRLLRQTFLEVSTMDARSKAVVGLAAALISPWVTAQAPGPDVFAGLSAMESPAISADGKQLAFIAHTPTESFVLVADLDGMQVKTVVQVNEGVVRRVFWASDEALVFIGGTTTAAPAPAGAADTGTPYGVDLTADGAVTRLLRNRITTSGGRGGPPPGQGGAQLVGWERSTGHLLYPKTDPPPELDRVLYSVDPKNDRQTVVDRGARSTRQWVVDESGEPVFRIDFSQPDRYTVLARREGRWAVEVEETAAIPEMFAYGLNASGDLVVRARPAGADRAGLYVLSTRTGELGDAILVDDRFDVEGAHIDPYTHRVVGSATDAGPVWFDEELGEHQALLDESFPGEFPRLASWSEDRTRFLVTTQSGQRSPAVYLYDASEPSLEQIGSAYVDLEGVRLPNRREYSYAARDGTSIPGYLTRPHDASGPTALIVLPHAGPAAHEVAGFDWMAHFFASRGYTVLQPNFRGSTGYGRAWQFAGRGGWGIGVMQNDLSDGVAALVEEGLADPDRVCIVGTSYGGYAALAGAVFTPELYRCAAAISPVSDLVALLGVEPSRRGGGFNPTVAYWRQAMAGGNGDGSSDRLRAASPAAHAELANASVLLIHGRDDSVVPIAQSQTMERALRSAGKDVELVELEGDDHWLSTAPSRLATLQALDRFLAEHLAE